MTITEFIILSFMIYYIFMIILQNCRCIRRNENDMNDINNMNNINNINQNINYIPIQRVVKKRQRAGSR